MNGLIKIGVNTSKHQANLETLGFNPSVVDGEIVCEVTGTVAEVDCSTKELLKASLKAMVEAKVVATYSTKFTFPAKDGNGVRVLFGIPACGVLGEMSCLIMKVAGSKKAAKATGITVADLLS